MGYHCSLQVFDVLDHPTSRILGTINFQLRSRKQAGFMLSRDWLKLLDAKVSILLLGYSVTVSNPFNTILIRLVDQIYFISNRLKC